MPNLMQSVGTLLSSGGGKTLNSLLGLAGAGENVYSGIQNAQNTSNYNATQKYIQSLVTNPKRMTAAAQGYTKPLDVGLTDAVTNQAQAALAERGLGGSGTAMTSAIAQAIAPYIQSNQQTGMQQLMNALGLAGGTKPMNMPGVDLTSLLKQLNLNGGAVSAPTGQMAQNEAGMFQMPSLTPDLAADYSPEISGSEADTSLPLSLFSSGAQAA